MSRAGDFRDRITVQRSTKAKDAYGNVVQGWSDHLKVWADMLETPGREVVAAGRVEAARTATIRVRSSSDTRALTEADRLLARGRTWNILSIAAVGRSRDQLELLCETGAAT